MKRKLLVLFSTMLLCVCAAIGTALPVSGASTYDALADWSKSPSAGNVVMTNTEDGALHFSQTATGAWDGNFYTAANYNTPVPIRHAIDMYLDIKSGSVGIVLSGNGYFYEQQGTELINVMSTIALVVTNQGDTVMLQRTDNWAQSTQPKQEGYNILSIVITESGTNVLFNDSEVFTFASTSADYIYGTANITVNRFSADGILDTVVKSIPVATNSSVVYNNSSAGALVFGYRGVSSTAVTGIKYAAAGSADYTAVDQGGWSAGESGISLPKDIAQAIFSETGSYQVIVETQYGNIYYDVNVTSQRDVTSLWSPKEAGAASVTAKEDGGVTYKNNISSGLVENSRTYEWAYNKSFPVNQDIVIDFIPVNGVGSIRLTDGAGGNSVLEFGFRKENDTSFVHSINYQSNWPAAALNAEGYTRLIFRIGDNSTEVFADGVSLGTADVNRSAFTSGQAGIEIGCFHQSWATVIEFDVRVGVAESVIATARYVQNSGKGVTFAYRAPFAPVAALFSGSDEIPAGNYTLTVATDEAGEVGFSAEQIDALFPQEGDYTLRLVTAMGDVTFALKVVNSVAMELPETLYTYDLYEGGDLAVPVYINLDSIISVHKAETALAEGSEYFYEAQTETLVIRESYLKTLAKGRNVFTIVSRENGEGISFTVEVTDHTPPAAAGQVTENFDKNTVEQRDISFSFNMGDNVFNGLSGNDVTEDDYTFDGSVLTIKKEFLANLAANESYEFTAQFTYGQVVLTVAVVNTTAPSAAVVSKNFNPSAPADVTFDINLYENDFVSFTGNNIAESDFRFEGGRLTVSQAYLLELSPDTYVFEFTSEAGTLALTIVIEEKEAPAVNTKSAVFDVQAPADVAFVFTMNGGTLLSFTGNGITPDDYSFADGTLTLKTEYLAELPVGDYTFVFEADNGTIVLTVSVLNDAAPSFDVDAETTVKYCRVTDKTVAFEVGIYTNKGKLLSVEGDTISSDDYILAETQTDGLSVLTIHASYLATLTFEDSGRYTLTFDNGVLVLELRFDYEINSEYLFRETGGAEVSNCENGFVSISQTAVQSEFNWGYVVDYTGELSTDKPITILYQFPQNPDKSWMYDVNISGGSHNYFWETNKTVFAEFGVDGTSFYQLRAGSYPADEWNYLVPSGLVCNPNGVNELVFDIGESDTKIYLNGVLINTSPRTRADFPDGKAYLRFSSTTTYTDSTPSCTYQVKVNGDVEAVSATKQYNVNVPAAVSYDLNFDNGQFVGLYYESAEGEQTELHDYRFQYTAFAASGVLTLEKEDIMNSGTLSQIGTHTLVVKSTGGEVRLYLVVSDKEVLELSENEFIYDQRLEEDISFEIWLNADKFVSVSGNEITENDYSFAEGILTLHSDYLKSLGFGEKTFKVVSEKNPQGIEFTVLIADYSDPVIITQNAVYDVQAPADVVIEIDVKAGTFVSVTGNYIRESDYTFDAATGKLTIFKEYFTGRGAGKLTFSAQIDIFGTNYDLSFTVDCVNSKTPAFEDGSAILNAVFDKNAPEDITFKVNANGGTFLALYGSYISAADYTYDAETGTIVIKKEYLATLSTGTKNTVNINFDNGKIDIVIEIVEGTQEEVGCNGSVTGGGIALSAVVLLSAVVGVCVIKRRKG